MGYRRPEEVVAPKAFWKLKQVLCNTGQDGWSVAEGYWHGRPQLAMRWNGDDDSGSSGNPQSTGHPTWMIIPEELAPSIRQKAIYLNTLLSMIDCELEQPQDYESGVFLIKATFSNDALKGDDDIHFDIPDLGPERLFRRDEKHPEQFRAPLSQGGSWQGVIVNGLWHAVVQTNGMPEHVNPYPPEIIRDRVKSQIATAITRLRI